MTLRFEAWTLPTAGTFAKITDIPALAGSTGTRELSAYSDSSIVVPADWDGLDQIISTTVGSLIRVYDGTTLVDEFLAERLDQPVARPSTITISGTQTNGIVEKLAVYPYNYPNDIPTAQDWVWGGPTILPALTLADLASVREQWELWHDGTGGSFTLTVDGQTTAAIDYTIVSPNVIENRLQALSTVDDVTVSGDGQSTRAIYELYNNATGGSQKLIVGEETATWAYNAAAGTVDTALQALTGITATTVTGSGTIGSPWVITFDNPPNPQPVTKDDSSLTGGTSTLTETTAGVTSPWVITFYDPPNPTTFTITDSLTGGSATLTQVTAGALDPSPITQSQYADARIDPKYHGTYDTPAIEVVETNLNTGSDWALLVNATGQFAGSQIILTVKPGHTYSNVSVPVRPDSNGSYRLVIRDIYENLIAGTDPWEVALTAGTYQTLTVPQFTVPDGVYQIIMRVAVVQATYADFRVDWQHATINEGDAEATPGEIVRILVENGQDERSAFTFLDIAGFTDTVDSDAVSWPSTVSFTASFGQHFGHVLDGLAGMGYEWQITPKASPSGGFTHDLDLFIPGGAGTDLTASTGGPAVMSGTVSAANVVKRIPAYTAAVAWGNETYLEDTDATRLTNFGRWERVFDTEWISSTASLQEYLDEQFAEQATNSTATQATVTGDDPTIPMVDYDVGDTIWWQFPGVLAKEARRIRRLSWTHQNLPSYTLHASTVHTDESAMAAAVNRLLNKYQRRRKGTDTQPFDVPIQPVIGPYDLIVAASNTVNPAAAHIICTGTADDAQIAAAIPTYLSANGGSVYLMAGDYNFTGQISAGVRSIIWQGAGPDTHITCTNASLAVFTQESATMTRATYRDFRMTGPGTGTASAIAQGNAASSQETYVERVDIDNFYRAVWGFRTGGVLSVTDCVIANCTQAGVEGDREGRLYVTDCDFEGNLIGVNADYAVSILKGNYFDAGSYGVYCLGTAYNQLVLNGNAFNNQSLYSVYLNEDQNDPAVIVGNNFNNTAYGVSFASTGSQTQPVVLVGNAFHDCAVAYNTTNKNAASIYESNMFVGTTPAITESGTHTHTNVAIDSLTDVDTTTTAPVNGDLLVFDGTNWVPQTTPFFGQIYLTTPTATTIASSGVFYKMLGTTTLVSGGNGFDMPANNRLRYTGTPTRTFMIAVTGGSTTANNSVTLQYRLAKNGTTIAATQINWLKKTGTDQRTFPINHIVELATNDYVELFVNNTTGTGNVTLQHMNMIANGIL